MNDGTPLNPANPAATAGWSPGPLLDQAELLGVRIGAWNHFAHLADLPAAGERAAAAITAGHGAAGVIDEMLASLHRLRSALVTELRADSDARAIRIDAYLAASRDGSR